jgi:hypothetical protein
MKHPWKSFKIIDMDTFADGKNWTAQELSTTLDASDRARLPKVEAMLPVLRKC